MSGTVIKREFPEGHGRPVDHPSTYEAAEALAGHRLDRRKNFAIIRGIVHESNSWTQQCSGCSCDCEACCMGYSTGHEPAGCRECGGKGKARVAMWLPIDSMMEQSLEQEAER